MKEPAVTSPSTRRESGWITRYIAPLLPVGLAAYGLWILLTGRATYRPGRGSSTVTLLAPDACLAGLFFVFLALLVTALGTSGRMEKWLFRVGLCGSLCCLVVEGARQLMGLAVYAPPH
ncbi:hypothetical protein SAMN05444746_10238 [Variovorax sp. OK212]|nr:hypothetical protein SAMN05518853_10238 [Variovorax sp. OK202]SFC42031.1 hypothetical protein SAMN05444746_10238 [Variovorax sp. OK212]